MQRYVASKVDQCRKDCMSPSKAREQGLEKFKFVFCVRETCMCVCTGKLRAVLEPEH